MKINVNTIILLTDFSSICQPPPITPSHINSYPKCSGAKSPGLAADMHFLDDVIAFIGPACAFALEPVARLASYWNTPVITGMGDQVQMSFACAIVIRVK